MYTKYYITTNIRTLVYLKTYITFNSDYFTKHKQHSDCNCSNFLWVGVHVF